MHLRLKGVAMETESLSWWMSMSYTWSGMAKLPNKARLLKFLPWVETTPSVYPGDLGSYCDVKLPKFMINVYWGPSPYMYITCYLMNRKRRWVFPKRHNMLIIQEMPFSKRWGKKKKKKVFESIKIVLLIVSMDTAGYNYSWIFQRLKICFFIF